MRVFTLFIYHCLNLSQTNLQQRRARYLHSNSCCRFLVEGYACLWWWWSSTIPV